MPAKDMQEIEVKLLIRSEDPLSVADSIVSLSSIAGYRLSSPHWLSIQDYYVDTPDRALKRADFSLRVREVNASPWLTLKGPPMPLEHGLAQRLELEIPWSEEALPQIFDELAGHGIGWPGDHRESPEAAPAEALAARGLEKVQYRENHRRVRNVLPPAEQGGPVLAELSVDSVVYHFKDRQIRHYEVEIEARRREGVVVLPVLAQELLAAHPQTLCHWGHGKLSTGRAVEALLARGVLEGLVDRQGRLTPAAYARLHRFLNDAMPPGN